MCFGDFEISCDYNLNDSELGDGSRKDEIPTPFKTPVKRKRKLSDYIENFETTDAITKVLIAQEKQVIS